jgi:AcrR family transcriptional regulator
MSGRVAQRGRTAAPADSARSLALLWGPHNQPGRSGLTLGRIVAAAIAVADEAGLDALSMRRVADHLGVGTMSLYTHVPGKSELIDLMVDIAAGELYADIDEPTRHSGDWRGALTFIAERNRDLYRRHPWLLELTGAQPVVGPHTSLKYEAELRPLDGIGLTDIEMDSVLALILTHVEGTARAQLGAERVRAERGTDDAEWWRTQEPLLNAIPAASQFPVAGRVGQAAGEAFQTASSPGHIFGFGLVMILDGVQQLIDGR